MNGVFSRLGFPLPPALYFFVDAARQNRRAAFRISLTIFSDTPFRAAFVPSV